MYFSTGRAVYHVFSHTPGCNESSGTKSYKLLFFTIIVWTHKTCIFIADVEKSLFCITCIQCLLLFVWVFFFFFFFARLSQNIPVFKSSQRSPAYTQFLTTLLGELHFKNEDLESLTRIFRADSPPEWSVNCKLFCMS